jgi:hypothetical protein
MKLRTIIDNMTGRYEVQVETFAFTAQEEEQLRNFGEPLVQVGGAFSGMVNRPGQQNTHIEITGDGAGAEALPVIQNGAVVSATVVTPGSGYTSATVTIVGDGYGATASARFGIGHIDIETAGVGYEPDDVLIKSGPMMGDTSVQLRVLNVNEVGGVLGVEIINPGSYTTVPVNPVADWGTNGIGTGFEADLNWGVVGVHIISSGSNYNVLPLAVAFQLPSATRRLRTDTPFKQVFDLGDDTNSDAKAKVWADTVAARCISARASIMSMVSPFEGETIITV